MGRPTDEASSAFRPPPWRRSEDYPPSDHVGGGVSDQPRENRPLIGRMVFAQLVVNSGYIIVPCLLLFSSSSVEALSHSAPVLNKRITTSILDMGLYALINFRKKFAKVI